MAVCGRIAHKAFGTSIPLGWKGVPGQFTQPPQGVPTGQMGVRPGPPPPLPQELLPRRKGLDVNVAIAMQSDDDGRLCQLLSLAKFIQGIGVFLEKWV